MKYLWEGYDGNGETTAGFTSPQAHRLNLHFNENGAKWKDSPKADDDRRFHEPRRAQHPTLNHYLKTEWDAEGSPETSCVKQQLQRLPKRAVLCEL